MTENKTFYNIGLHMVNITGFRYYYSKENKNPTFEVTFDVVQEINKADNKIIDHQRVYGRNCRITFTKNNFDISVSQVNSLLKACQINEPFTDFTKLDPENPEHFKIVGKKVPMYCSHKDGWERWQPDSQPNNAGKKKEPLKNESSAAEELNNLFGARLMNAAMVNQQEEGHDTANDEPSPVSEPMSDELPF